MSRLPIILLGLVLILIGTRLWLTGRIIELATISIILMSTRAVQLAKEGRQFEAILLSLGGLCAVAFMAWISYRTGWRF